MSLNTRLFVLWISCSVLNLANKSKKPEDQDLAIKRANILRIVDEIRAECAAEGFRLPTRRTIKARLDAMDQREVMRKRGVSVVVPVKVDMDERIGAATIWMVQIAGQNATIVCEPDDAPSPSQDMEFEIDMQKISLFGSEGGARL